MAVTDQDEERPLLHPDGETPSSPGQNKDSKSVALTVSFLVMIVVGLGNKVFNVLETTPMNNYPFFLNFYTSLIYIPLSFAYIWPMILFGKLITREQRAIPLHKFAIMGFLDGTAGIMQVFATTKIPSGALVILLSQAAIPISMVISKILLKYKYEIQHYVGAATVFIGLGVVILPTFLNPQPSDAKISTEMIVVWCVVMILSCVPMTLSSVYKEKSLGEQDIDVVYLNGWVAVFQVLISVAFAIPAAYAIGLDIQDIPSNFVNGAKCYVGRNSVESDSCGDSPLYVNIYLFFNVIYNILIIMILKYGSSNLLWLAMTIMVPLGFAVFAIPGMPRHASLQVESILGLVIIMSGLIIYRFFGPIKKLFMNRNESKPMQDVTI